MRVIPGLAKWLQKIFIVYNMNSPMMCLVFRCKFFLLIGFSFFVKEINAQSIANYASVRNAGVSYQSINATGKAFDSWRNTATYTQDDNRSDFTDIGFDFWYNGVRYTQFSVSTNGFIDFSASAADGTGTGAFGYINSAFTSNSNPGIAAFYDDLTAQGGTSALGNSIKYDLSGSAPSRTLTIEWINMAVYGNVSPSLNFQVKLVETTGSIFVNYGTMNTGTFTFSYSTGLNGQTLSFFPTAAQLKELQTANVNTFSSAAQSNLSAMPVVNSQYIFTSPVPATAAGALSFSAVSQTGMTVNWPNWAANEVGYVIYNSTDNVNFNFMTQTASNAVSFSLAGLSPSTNYYWKVYAVTEGCLSSALTGTQSTLSAGNKISRVSGPWNTATTWTPTGVPTAVDNVTIANTHTVTIDADVVCNDLVIGQGSSGVLTIGNSNTARNSVLNGNLTINSNAVFNINTASNTTHNVTVPGNIINNGTLNFATDANSLADITFNKNGNQTVSGSGATTVFNRLTLNMGTSVNNILDIQTPGFVTASNFLTLTSGTFKLSTPGTSNLIPFTGSATIPQRGGVWLNSALSTISVQATLTMYGNVTVSNGIFNVGNAADEDLLSNGGYLTISSGTLNIAGKYYSTNINNLSKFTISGGNVIVPSMGSTNTAIAPFQIAGAGSQFNMSGGYLIIPREGGSGAQNLGFVNTGTSSGSVTGGTLQIGSGASPVATQVIQINSNYPIGNLLVNSASVNASLLTNSLSVVGDITINTGSLSANSFDFSLGKNWTNNGGTFAGGTGNVVFLGTGSQTIFKSGGETFNNLSFVNTGSKTLLSAITASNIIINSGSNLDVNTGNFQISAKGNFLNSGLFNAQKGFVLLNGTSAQSIGGTSTTDFYNLALTNSTGASLANAENLINTLTLSNGTFNTSGQVFTMVSTATNTARIAQITGTGDITGNVTVQRFAPGGYTGWALLGTPISSALTLQDWDDNMPISCASCPDGSAGGFISIYSYDETAVGTHSAAASYIPMNGITDPIVPNTGYWVYLGTGYTATNPITIDVTGTVRKFNNSIPLKRTNTGSPSDDGWNLIHNPYPSAIKWSLLRGATANIDNAVYGYNADLNGGLGGPASYVNGVSSPALGAGGIGDTIPMCQGFYVHCTGATTLNATEANKVGGNPAFLRTNQASAIASSTVQLIRLYLDGMSNYHDETVVYIQPGATTNFDASYDAIKRESESPGAPAISLNDGTTDFQINGIAPITSNFSMPLRATTGYPGTYTISLANFNSFPSGACINLYDTLTGITTDLKTSDYPFTLSSTDTTSRFVLTITLNPLSISSGIIQPNCSNPAAGNITVAGNSSGPWNYTWKDDTGAIVKTSLNKLTADTLTNLPGGNYSIEINTVGQCDNNTSVFSVNDIILPLAQFNSVDTVDLSNGGIVTFNNVSTNAQSFDWNFGDYLGSSFVSNPSYAYQSIGNYSVQLIATSSSGCVDSITKAIVVVSNTTTGIENVSANSHFIIKTLPNNTYILESTITEGPSIVYLADNMGKTILNYGTITDLHYALTVDLNNLKSGIYYLTVKYSKQSKTFKLVVN